MSFTIGRLTAVLWWFAVMIISATYTANMAAFLTRSRSQSSINSIEDLGSQRKIEYGEKVVGICKW